MDEGLAGGLYIHSEFTTNASVNAAMLMTAVLEEANNVRKV